MNDRNCFTPIKFVCRFESDLSKELCAKQVKIDSTGDEENGVFTIILLLVGVLTIIFSVVVYFIIITQKKLLENEKNILDSLVDSET